MADNALGVSYHRLHHFLTEAPWDAQQVGVVGTPLTKPTLRPLRFE